MAIVTDTAVFSLMPEGILRATFFSNDKTIDLEEAVKHIDAANKLTSGKKALVLIDARQSLHNITKEAKEFISKSDNKIAEAILVKELHQRIVVNFYLKVANTFSSHPTKIFTDETEAVNWLLTSIKKIK